MQCYLIYRIFLIISECNWIFTDKHDGQPVAEIIPTPIPYVKKYRIVEVTYERRKIAINKERNTRIAIPLNKYFFGPYFYILCPNTVRVTAKLNKTAISRTPTLIKLKLPKNFVDMLKGSSSKIYLSEDQADLIE